MLDPAGKRGRSEGVEIVGPEKAAQLIVKVHRQQPILRRWVGVNRVYSLLVLIAGGTRSGGEAAERGVVKLGSRPPGRQKCLA